MSSGASRVVAMVLGILVAIAGILCLNYTNGFGIAHHAEWAAESGMPAPTYGIFIAGAILAIVGAGIAGHSMGRGRRQAA